MQAIASLGPALCLVKLAADQVGSLLFLLGPHLELPSLQFNVDGSRACCCTCCWAGLARSLPRALVPQPPTLHPRRFKPCRTRAAWDQSTTLSRWSLPGSPSAASPPPATAPTTRWVLGQTASLPCWAGCCVGKQGCDAI